MRRKILSLIWSQLFSPSPCPPFSAAEIPNRFEPTSTFENLAQCGGRDHKTAATAYLQTRCKDPSTVAKTAVFFKVSALPIKSPIANQKPDTAKDPPTFQNSWRVPGKVSAAKVPGWRPPLYDSSFLLGNDHYPVATA